MRLVLYYIRVSRYAYRNNYYLFSLMAFVKSLFRIIVTGGNGCVLLLPLSRRVVHIANVVSRAMSC